MTDRWYWAALQMTPGLGAVRLRRLAAQFGGPKAAWLGGRRDLIAAGLDEKTCDRLMELRRRLEPASLAAAWEKRGIRICCREDVEYPVNLKNIYQAPQLFYYRGELPTFERAVAVVGTRKASPYGRAAASQLGAELAAAGVTVVSGAARGIDAAAHGGALSKGLTAAVLGCGIDQYYPAENRALIDRIAGAGVVISEYPPGAPPHFSYFPARNRIISGLSAGVVVVEAPAKSGALITAERALEEGRDVFAVPGSIYSDHSAGCHGLIRQGAQLVARAADILAEYRWGRPPERTAPEPALAPAEEAVYAALDRAAPAGAEEIMLKTGLELPRVAYTLLQLQLRGLAAEKRPRAYVRA